MCEWINQANKKVSIKSFCAPSMSENRKGTSSPETTEIEPKLGRGSIVVARAEETTKEAAEKKDEATAARLQIKKGSELAQRAPQRGSKPTLAKTRLDHTRDCGKTKADETQVPGPWFCWRFSRGVCTYGPDCVFLHRLPTLKHQFGGYLDATYDIFGRTRREKVADWGHSALFVGGITPGGGNRVGGWAEVEQEALRQVVVHFFFKQCISRCRNIWHMFETVWLLRRD